MSFMVVPALFSIQPCCGVRTSDSSRSISATVFFGILAGFVFEVEVAEVVEEDFAALAQVFEAGFLVLGFDVALRPEDVEEGADGEEGAGEGGHGNSVAGRRPRARGHKIDGVERRAHSSKCTEDRRPQGAVLWPAT
jgi:hypothetical protein